MSGFASRSPHFTRPHRRRRLPSYQKSSGTAFLSPWGYLDIVECEDYESEWGRVTSSWR
jgi:hypothetical protein